MKTYIFSPNSQKIKINLKEVGLPEVPLIGIHNLSSAKSGLGEHTHPGLMEICYLTKGEQVYSVDGQDYVMKGNDVFVTYPDEYHGSGDNPHGKGLLYWLQIALPTRPMPFLALSPKEAHPLLWNLQALPRRHFRGNQRLQLLFEEIFHLYHEMEGPLKKIAIVTCLLEWFLIIIKCAHTGMKERLSDDIRRVLERIGNNLEKNYTMDELAESIYLSTSRFKAKFREQVGVPPGEYILRCKVGHARKLLEKGDQSITDVAYLLGFSSSQYFATVFKRFTNLRPSDVRKQGTMLKNI